MPRKTKPVAILEKQPSEIQGAWALSLYTAIKQQATRHRVWTQCRADMKKDGFDDAMLRYGSVMWGLVFSDLSEKRVKWALDKKIDREERTLRFVHLYCRFWFICWWQHANKVADKTILFINAQRVMDDVDLFRVARKYDDYEFFMEFLRLAGRKEKSNKPRDQRGDRRTKFHLVNFWISHSLWTMTNAARADFINQKMLRYRGERIGCPVGEEAVKSAVRRLGL